MATGYAKGYGQPANPGRGMFGSGRISAGRGQMMSGRNMAMPGRGVRGGMMPGRGVRGGMMPGRGVRGGMMPGRGRGGRGRMMPAQGRGGRGRMMPFQGRGGRMMASGRGGRGRMVNRIPSKLDVFNRYVGFKILSFCDRDDQENLGFAFPQFTPAPLTQQQLQMRMKKIAEKKKTLENPYGIKDIDLNEDTDTNDGNGKGIGDYNKNLSSTSNSGTKVVESGDKISNESCNASEREESSNDNKTDNSNKEKEIGDVNDEGNESIVSEVNVACNLGIDLSDGVETFSPNDESCDCEAFLNELRKKTNPCNCRSCRETNIKAIQNCGCNRCRVLKNKLTKVPIFSQNDSNPEQASIETEMDPEKKKQLMKEREESMRINMTDCHTLLAQLNTKRLYRRIKYFKRKDSNYNVDKAYAYNKDTAEISKIEWEALIEDYKARLFKLKEQEAIEQAAKAGKKSVPRKKTKKNKKSKKKKKKGKGNKSEKSKNTEDTSQEAEEVNLVEENDAENESDSDDDVTDSISDSDVESIDGEDFLYVGDKPSKYELLMFTPCPRAVAVLASYPRSGNSLMRNLYEKITLRVTGSDMMGGLQKHDLVGEMATGTNNVQFVKTHYPERMGHPAFAVSRAVLLVRNPYDAMDSYFNLMSTSTHTTSLTPEARKKYAKLFGEMAMKEILVWRDFHEYWLKQKIPLLVVRYEDLIRDTVRVIKKVIKFVLEINSMTFFEDRIQRAIGEEQVEKLGPYKARSGGIGKSLMKGNYTPQLLNHINYGIVGTMEKFGYREMMVPNPKSWKLEPIDQWGVYIPGSSTEPMIINQKGLVRGPNRQTNWRQVKMIMEKDKREAKERADGKTIPKKVDLL